MPFASDREALGICFLIEGTIQDLERGKLVMPLDADPLIFIVSGGKVANFPKVVSETVPFTDKPPCLKKVLDIYAETLTPGSKEANTIETEAIHRRHFIRLLGENAAFDAFELDALQSYVDRRAREGVGRETIRKELSTLRVIWGWAHKRGYVASPLSWKMGDLTLPKSDERPQFQTWEQITRKIERAGLSKSQQAESWECLWLNEEQTVACVRWVEENARYRFLPIMFAFAAFTGARRGELIRSLREDWDFEGGIVSIRQKKADKSRTFTRRNVPIHPILAKAMSEWFHTHPGNPWTIATDDGSPIGPRMATKYFRGAVKGGKWAVLHGWHTFRHSLASNMASSAIDQRVINEILGHHTEEMERRYRHLLPRKQAEAIGSMFRVN
jgi:integrase